MKCLVISDTFPNRTEPSRGPYNRQQVEALAELCEVAVINPIPWPSVMSRPALLRAIREGGDGLLRNVRLAHPLHVYVPLLGRPTLGHSLYRCVRKRALAEAAAAPFDVVYATWAFPHGYAAMRVAHACGRPFVLKLRGSDVNGLPPSGLRRRFAAQAIAEASAVVAVSRRLADEAVAMGAAADRVHVLHNGVDLARFQPESRAAARARLGMPQEQKVVLFVGNLVPVKAPGLLLEAFAQTRAGTAQVLVLLGSGPMQKGLQALAARLCVAGRVRFAGTVPHGDVPAWINAADLLCLPSWSEGCPNVVLEALACGTPVVASRVGAVPELLDDACGIIVEPGGRAELAAAIESALGRDWDRASLRRRVEGMSWADNARRLHAILSGVVARPGRDAAGADNITSCADGS
jgi:glycosyltransferase involved in cell wall biosynthesis